MSGHGMVLKDSDCDPSSLTEIGTVTISVGRIEIDGFAGNAETDRLLTAQSVAWAIQVLQAELAAIKASPGGGSAVLN